MRLELEVAEQGLHSPAGGAWHRETKQICQPVSAVGPVPGGQQVFWPRPQVKRLHKTTPTTPGMSAVLQFAASTTCHKAATGPHTLTIKRHPRSELVQSLPRGERLRCPRDTERPCAGKLRALHAPLGGEPAAAAPSRPVSREDSLSAGLKLPVQRPGHRNGRQREDK